VARVQLAALRWAKRQSKILLIAFSISAWADRQSLYGKNGFMRETAERFREPATISCTVFEMNHSLLTAKNDSPFHHSLDTPSFAVECSKMFYSKSFQHV
jgi:hypothetical protein